MYEHSYFFSLIQPQNSNYYLLHIYIARWSCNVAIAIILHPWALGEHNGRCARNIQRTNKAESGFLSHLPEDPLPITTRCLSLFSKILCIRKYSDAMPFGGDIKTELCQYWDRGVWTHKCHIFILLSKNPISNKILLTQPERVVVKISLHEKLSLFVRFRRVRQMCALMLECTTSHAKRNNIEIFIKVKITQLFMTKLTLLSWKLPRIVWPYVEVTVFVCLLTLFAHKLVRLLSLNQKLLEIRHNGKKGLVRYRKVKLSTLFYKHTHPNAVCSSTYSWVSCLQFWIIIDASFFIYSFLMSWLCCVCFMFMCHNPILVNFVVCLPTVMFK